MFFTVSIFLVPLALKICSYHVLNLWAFSASTTIISTTTTAAAITTVAITTTITTTITIVRSSN